MVFTAVAVCEICLGGGSQGFKACGTNQVRVKFAFWRFQKKRSAYCAEILPGTEKKKFNSFHCPNFSTKMQVKSIWACHFIIVWTLKLTAYALCGTANEVYRYHLIHASLLYLYHFRDRSIPELDEILDAKLSEVQDHMRTLMQKQVRACQPPCNLLLCCCSGGHLLLGVTEAAWTISMKQLRWFEHECNYFFENGLNR